MKERISYLDRIKGFSIIMVVFCHTALLPKDSILGNILMSLAWGAVPCFFLVSGGIMNCSRHFSWKKYFIRLIKIYLVLAVWKLIYLLAYSSVNDVSFSKETLFKYLFLFGNIENVNTGVMWFMTAYLLALLLYPITWFLFNCGKKGETAAGFLMLISFVGGIGVNFVNFFVDILRKMTPVHFPTVERINMVLPLGDYKNFVFYFILGGFLFRYRNEISAFIKSKKLLMALPPLMVVAGTAGLTVIKFVQTGSFRWNGVYLQDGYGFFSAMVLAVGAYLFVQIYLSSPRMRITDFIGRNTMGIYYIHYVLLGVCVPFLEISTDNYSLLLNIAKTVITVIISLAITFVIKKIPLIKNLAE